ncbi:zf-primase domain-containing protein [Mycena indigotica]|uniref:Zf-primase domain-containing protein n=1 Tax=Mycena indigotica TaxID=2126181 RepID=A0A8H6SE32_9AGAR|nr:zf-primase domain-containing protein [Mycena indigotica]KAF7297262.1 zf-primase domain-containing protein [Mycena indigotica]
MESLANIQRLERQKKADLKRQIALLQAQMGDLPDSDPEESPSPKRQKLNNVLAPATPSPKKKTRSPQVNTRPALQALTLTKIAPKNEFVPFRPTASTVLSKLANTKPSQIDDMEVESLPRSTAFTDAPKAPEPIASTSVLQRDERLALVETLEMGPYEHTAPFDDPRFEQVEPNSGIRLISRAIPHEDVQDYLRGRYYLSPSRLYSSIRLLPNQQGYDVPVDGDWITIAVVAERGPYKYSKAPVEVSRDEDDTDIKHKRKGKEKDKSDERKSSGKRYVNLKLVDFGRGSRSKSSATGGKTVIGGDAQLSLLLFESDGFDVIEEPDGSSRKIHRGGSRGAFEEIADIREGTVLALLNPRILKPFQKSENPHPTTNILAVTPESGSSVLVLGRSKDLGRCSAEKRDGSTCGSWFDKRVSEVCEWHVQYAVTQRRAGRAEFAASTSGLGSTAKASKRKGDYDPRKKWGLAPLDAEKGPTYVFSGHVVGAADVKESMRVAENMGREGQAKASRRMAARDEDLKIMKALGKRGGDKAQSSKELPTKDNEKDLELKPKITISASKTAYTPELIQRIGFDPTLKPGQRRSSNMGSRNKLDQLARLTADREVKLGPKPGERLMTTVRVPQSALGSKATAKPDVQLDSDDELPACLTLSKVKSNDDKMVDLDSDSD